MKRRNFLAGSLTIPALGASIATAAVIRDPHSEWFDRWRRLREEWRLSVEGSQEEAALWEHSKSVEESLSSCAAQTTGGALAQIEWMLADSLDMDFQTGHREALELALQSLKSALPT